MIDNNEIFTLSIYGNIAGREFLIHRSRAHWSHFYALSKLPYEVGGGNLVTGYRMESIYEGVTFDFIKGDKSEPNGKNFLMSPGGSGFDYETFLETGSQGASFRNTFQDMLYFLSVVVTAFDQGNHRIIKVNEDSSSVLQVILTEPREPVDNFPQVKYNGITVINGLAEKILRRLGLELDQLLLATEYKTLFIRVTVPFDMMFLHGTY